MRLNYICQKIKYTCLYTEITDVFFPWPKDSLANKLSYKGIYTYMKHDCQLNWQAINFNLYLKMKVKCENKTSQNQKSVTCTMLFIKVLFLMTKD